MLVLYNPNVQNLIISLLFVEITVVGGFNNNKTLIRRKKADLDMAVVDTFNVLRKDEPLKLLIEITNGEFHTFRYCDWI